MRERFEREYKRAVDDVLRFLTEPMQEEMSLHNAGWRRGATDFRVYLLASETRFLHALDALELEQDSSVCDVGGFWGVWPLTLARLGVRRVAMTEALEYYNDVFDPLFAFLRGEGVRVMDFDPFGSGEVPEERFDVVTLMAVLEHYPHSPRVALSRVLQMLDQTGRLLIEVPNIAYGPKRLAMLHGLSPLPPLRDVWSSEIPFTGHHREYTRAELRELASLAGLSILDEYEYDYSREHKRRGLLAWVRHPIEAYVETLSDTGEVLAMVCERQSASG